MPKLPNMLGRLLCWLGLNDYRVIDRTFGDWFLNNSTAPFKTIPVFGGTGFDPARYMPSGS